MLIREIRVKHFRFLKMICESVYCVYFEGMRATLTELRRDTSSVVRPAIHAGQTVVLTEHGEPCAEIIPVRKIDRKALCQALIDLGPIEFVPRK
jgi:prevent-host-death family protein